MWMPIMVFFYMGFEHSIVNMFLFPSGLMLGGEFTLVDYLIWNEIPTVIGNLVGGLTFTGLTLYSTHIKTAPTRNASAGDAWRPRHRRLISDADRGVFREDAAMSGKPVPAAEIRRSFRTRGARTTNQDFHGVLCPDEPLLSPKGIAIALADGISSSKVAHVASKSAVRAC